MTITSRWTAVLLAGLVAVTGCTGGAAEPDTAGLGAPAIEVSPDIRVSDADVLTDERTDVTVAGLEPGAPVTVAARRTDDLDRIWLAGADFTADASGVVDLATRAPEAGTYTGAAPMGLFRSMRPVDGAPPGPPVPVAADPAASITLTALVDGAAVAETTVVQRTAASGVTRREVREDGLVGVLHAPPGPGPHPGVILLSGSEGGVPVLGLAGLLASRGYAAFSLAYFGEEGLPDELVEIPLEYVGGGMDWLGARPDVVDGPVGVLGPSRGGELALLLGATFPDRVGAVVSFVGSGIGYAGLPTEFGASMPAAWTHRGRDVPYLVPAIGGADAFARYVGPGLVGAPIADIAGTWPDILAAGPAAIGAATIPVERTAGPVLLLSGTDDRLWPSAPMSDVAQRRLSSHGHEHPHEHVSYPGAGHWFIGAPYAVGLPTAIDSPFGTITGGGDPDADARAAADAWPRVLDTLERGLGS